MIDGRELRRCLGQFASGVTVVGCRAGDRWHGATVSAFTSVSLDPPLVLLALDRRSKACAYLDGQPFSVTVLDAAALDAALHFAGRAPVRSVPQWVDAGGVPRLPCGAASIICSPWASYDGGDHVLYLGEVREFSYRADADPLVFHSGQFRSLRTLHGRTPWQGTLDSPESALSWWTPPCAA